MKTLKKITAGITLTLAAMTATGCQTIQSTVESTATEAASSATDALLDEGKAKLDSMLDKGKDALSDVVGGASSSDASSFDSSSYTGKPMRERRSPTRWREQQCGRSECSWTPHLPWWQR